MGRLWVKLVKRLDKRIFWTVWKEKNLIAFDNEELSIQRLKNSFVCNLWSWSRVFVDMSPISLVSFIDWLDSK